MELIKLKISNYWQLSKVRKVWGYYAEIPKHNTDERCGYHFKGWAYSVLYHNPKKTRTLHYLIQKGKIIGCDGWKIC